MWELPAKSPRNAGSEPLQALDMGGDVGLVRGLDAFDEGLHEVGRPENGRYQLGTGRDLAIPHPVENFFQPVGQRPDAVQAQKSGRSLDGVHRPEHGIHKFQIDVCPAGFDRQHLLFDIGQTLLGFDDELGNQAGIRNVHSNTMRWSCVLVCTRHECARVTRLIEIPRHAAIVNMWFTEASQKHMCYSHGTVKPRNFRIVRA